MASSYDVFGFTRWVIPAEPVGPWRNVPVLLRVAAWIAFAGGVFSILGSLFLLGVSNLFGGPDAGTLVVRVLALARAVVGVGIAVWFMVWCGRAMEDWLNEEPDAPATVKTLATWLIIVGAVALFSGIAGGFLVAAGLLTVGIILLVTLGKPELAEPSTD